MFGSRKEQEVEVLPNPRPQKKFFGRKWIFLFFFLIIGSLLFFAFVDKVSLTGNVIGIGGIGGFNKDDSFALSASLGELNSSLEFKQVIERVVIEPEPVDGDLFLGRDIRINFAEVEDPVVILEFFDGVLSFDKSEILSLDGTAERVRVNGIVVGGEDFVDVSFNEPVSYARVSVSDVYIRSFEELVSGTVEAKEKTFFTVNEEVVTIRRFQGDVKSGIIGIGRRGVSFDGLVNRLSIDGEVDVDLRN